MSSQQKEENLELYVQAYNSRIVLREFYKLVRDYSYCKILSLFFPLIMKFHVFIPSILKPVQRCGYPRPEQGVILLT